MREEGGNGVDVGIPARDGFELAGTRYPPSGRRRGTVLINSATAVPRRFYRRFAAEIANAGYEAVTYDYRGIGDSRPQSLRGFETRMRDWGLLDMAGVIDWARAENGETPLFLVGHSVGGQVAGLVDNAVSVDGMATISAQSGYWGVQGAEQKWLAGFHVHVTFPVLTRLVGYMPWSWLGSATDLPRGAALEWAEWCRNPDYLLGDESLPLDRYAGFEAPVLAYSIGDDKWGTQPAVNAMMSAYPNLERRHIEPTEHGLDALGHFGYFRAPARHLWSDLIAWLNDRS
jgi:predicted alpha/beta hydrolase